MLTQLAVSGYRSLRDVSLPLAQLTIVTGENGTGKSSVYRALRLLADVAQGRLINSLAREGGLPSTLWAGPERIGREMRAGKMPVQGTRRTAPIGLRLGFSGDDLGYAIDLGLPTPGSAFPLDPHIKAEAMWTGGQLGRANVFAERRGQMVRVRRLATGEWRDTFDELHPFESMISRAADRDDGLELMLMRDRMRNWRFYDNLRVDPEAPVRRPQVVTYTPALANDGADLAAAIETIRAVGDGDGFDAAVEDAFPASSIETSEDGRIAMRQKGLLRPLMASELSDGTLRYIMLCAALLASARPEILILNEPESSLHPSLLPALARLLAEAARSCQIVVVSHSEQLVAAMVEADNVRRLQLEKDFGETVVRGGEDAKFAWTWPAR